MNLLFACPHCQRSQQTDLSRDADRLACEDCDWSRPISPSDWAEQTPARCLACGCHDLWRQKDFPQGIGLSMVGLGALLSTIAWANYWPKTALGILMGFALIDLLFYALMPDVLVCYHCEARHRQTADPELHPRFNLETAERYRQEALRQAARPS